MQTFNHYPTLRLGQRLTETWVEWVEEVLEEE
ncbi:hypothetical protein [Vreelandella glaciei]